MTAGNANDLSAAEGPKAAWLPPHPWALKVHPWCFGAFCIAMVLYWLVLLSEAVVEIPFVDRACQLLVLLTTVIGLARYLPLQQIIPGVLVAAIVFLPFWWFRPAFTWIPDRDWEDFVIFPAVLLSARGSARLILLPIQRLENRGIVVIFLTALLAWLAHPVPENGVVFVAGVIALTVNPWFVSKHPYSLPLDLHPLWVWGLVSLLCSSWQMTLGATMPAILGFAGLVVTTVLAFRGYAYQRLGEKV